MDHWLNHSNGEYMGFTNHWMDRPNLCCHFRHGNYCKDADS